MGGSVKQMLHAIVDFRGVGFTYIGYFVMDNPLAIGLDHLYICIKKKN